ncbi:serine/threonine protein kinase [Massilia forsythiae]|uniref:Serine/threonine protein kinase n=1 Tax=Massilia forsythiae TaxID=2728020 RepID=A0A7Z2W083_9BURK|nr:protein kinase [Massilia forsythiae]QJE02672.1 serine/threonine protein kinase [Massilia forsythiae]
MYAAGDIIALTGGAWRLRAPMAASSYGVLWRAEPCLGGAPAALKLVNLAQMALALPPQRACWTRDAAAEIGFLRALQPWDRRHIVRLLDSGVHLDQPAMALELLDGDLARHLECLRLRGERVSFAQALAWTAQVNAALAKVHQYGWRYLDLKPANLLVDKGGGNGGAALKLADFGTNRPLADARAHAYAGTASWQAPEQFFEHEDGGYRTDARTDYFALGALLYHLATGVQLRFGGACAGARRVHGSAAAAWLRERHGGAVPPPLAPDEAALFLRHALPHGAGCGEAALALLRALLAAHPDGRPRHALEISRLIERVRLGAGDAVQPLRSAA